MTYDFDELVNRENTNCIKYDFRKTLFGTDELIPMWVADMDFKTPAFVFDAIKERTNHEILGYTHRDEKFYQAVSTWIFNRHQWKIKDKWIVFTPGVIPAISTAITTFTEPGDQIIIQPPVYPPFHSTVKGLKRKLVYNHLKIENGRYTIDFDDLKQKIKLGAKMLILSNPHNPTGNVWKKEELLELGTLCQENGIIIFSDEIHSDLIHQPNKHIPLASLSDEIANITLTSFAPSKTFNLAGMSSACMVIKNPVLRKKFESELETLHIHLGNIFGNIAMETAYSKGEEWLEQLLTYIKGNRDYLVEFFKKDCPEIKMYIPEGSYMAWLDCRNMGIPVYEVKIFFIEKAKLGLSDGQIFGKEYEGFQRINFACPRSVVIEACKRIKEAIKKIK